MIYLPFGKTVTINASFIKSETLMAWWFNPKTGSASSMGLLKKSVEMEFTTPTTGIENDWVLVLDDPSAKFSPPGK